jgi:hypothetical protein
MLRLNMVVGNIIRNIFSESEEGSNLLQQETGRLVEDCLDDDYGNERNQGNDNNNRGRGRSNGDDGNDDEDYD